MELRTVEREKDETSEGERRSRHGQSTPGKTQNRRGAMFERKEMVQEDEEEWVAEDGVAS